MFRPLLSVDKLTEAGNKVVLEKPKSYIITKNGSTIPLKRKNGVFIMELCIKEDGPGFTRQGR